jgi:hypothetical protein
MTARDEQHSRDAFAAAKLLSKYTQYPLHPYVNSRVGVEFEIDTQVAALVVKKLRERISK